MVVENAPLGTRAAKAAGLFTCAVNTGILPDADLEAEHADKVFPNMAALLKWLTGRYNISEGSAPADGEEEKESK